MIYHRLRFDIWICLVISFILSYIPVKFIEKNNNYETYVEEHTVAEDDIGGKASDEIIHAQSIDDMLNNSKFTIISQGIKYRNEGAGYYNSQYMYAVTLPSGERVAALINMDSVQNMGDSIYTGKTILPVGKIVYDDLSSSKNFLNQIEHSKKLSRHDFYIDMLGEGGKLSKNDYVAISSMIVQIISIIVCFSLLHLLGSKIGVFPILFKIKDETKKSEWD